MVASLAVLGLFAAPVHASGRLPSVPIPPRDFADFAGRRAFLDETHRQDMAKVDPAPTPIEGGTRQTLVETKGPTSEDASHANYEATEGWQVRRPVPAEGHTVVSYRLESYERQPASNATS